MTFGDNLVTRRRWCAHCAAPFRVGRGGRDHRARYCCDRCRDRHHNQAHRARAAARPRRRGLDTAAPPGV